MADEIVARLSRFRRQIFPRFRREFRQLVDDGQHPTALFIGCSDSRVVPHLLTGFGPGELFVVRNVGAFVPPFDVTAGYHGTVAAVEFAVKNLRVRDIVVCGHSHCGAVRALYADPDPETPHIDRWLDLGRDAVLPVTPGAEALRRTEQRCVALQLERLLAYPLVARGVDAGELFLHGWHYVIEDGEVWLLDVESGEFRPADGPRGDPGGAPVVDLLQ
jgi:carbonic anhydrase